MPVYFYSEDTSFSVDNQGLTANWIASTITAEGKRPAELSFIMCSDEYLLQINQKYRSHDAYTDVISFDNCDGNDISGDIFISIDRVMDNSTNIGVDFTDELHRVIIHGVLHLIGYNDKEEAEQIAIRDKEDYYLSLRAF